MAKVLVSTKEMDRSEWLQHRRRGIGSSDAAAVAGLDPHRSPLQVYLEKVGELSDDESSEAAHFGLVLEDVVAQEFSRRTGMKVRRRNAILQHPEYPWMIANLDRTVVDGTPGLTPLEIKTTSAWLKGDWEDGRVPDRVMIQLLHQMAVTGASHGYVAVLIGGNRFQWAEVERDEEAIEHLIDIERQFWQLVENRTPPELDGSAASVELLKLLYPTGEPGSEVSLTHEADALVAEIEAAKTEEAAAKERRQAAENKLKAMLGNYERGLTPAGRQVTWATIQSARLDTKALKEQRPEIYQEFVRVSEYRRFAIR